MAAFILRSVKPVSSFILRAPKINPVICVNTYRFKSGGKGRDGNDSDQPSLADKFVPLDDNVSEEIIDFHEEQFGFRWDEKHQQIDPEMYVYRKKNKPSERAKQVVDVKRGVEGVFDLPELVQVLKDEKVTDVAVISVPGSANYCKYMILATAKSAKHLDAVMQYVRKLYKRKKDPSDPSLPYIGDDSNWRVLDMGYIVVHLFLPKVREIYEIESLWCLGPEFDEKTLNPDYGELVSQMEKHIKFLQDMQPMSDSSEGQSQGSL